MEEIEFEKGKTIVLEIWDIYYYKINIKKVTMNFINLVLLIYDIINNDIFYILCDYNDLIKYNIEKIKLFFFLCII